MKLWKALLLFASVSTAYGLRCYVCTPADPTPCTRVSTCLELLDRCFTLDVGGHITKGCQSRLTCAAPFSCCQGDLCNGALPVGPSVLLLLLSSAIVCLFL
ncbi:CD59 glycoprotein-like [Sphaeramia orbicularis]|uniref:CD59 glycoprotein-like n=1 Tax=Sphaeramia orbicularis TaxID=375764 RepID=UPI00117D7C69|nr:CD59 glycoprotein-like [Sphaeramia orbicularis]